MKWKEPTGEECSNNTPVVIDGQEVGFAAWYPQMGGYLGKCIVLTNKVDPDRDSTCFDALVWHNGEFPFGDSAPYELHHCMPEQFIRFGEQVLKYQKGK